MTIQTCKDHVTLLTNDQLKRLTGGTGDQTDSTAITIVDIDVF